MFAPGTRVGSPAVVWPPVDGGGIVSATRQPPSSQLSPAGNVQPCAPDVLNDSKGVSYAWRDVPSAWTDVSLAR